MISIITDDGRDVTALQPVDLARKVDALGLCVGSFTDAWFPPEPSPRLVEAAARRAEYEATARELCRGCPVDAECLELDVRDIAEGRRPYGVSGGRAPWERQALAEARSRVASVEVSEEAAA